MSNEAEEPTIKYISPDYGSNPSYLFIDIHIYIGNEVLAETAEMVSYYSEKWTQG